MADLCQVLAISDLWLRCSAFVLPPVTSAERQAWSAWATSRRA